MTDLTRQYRVEPRFKEVLSLIQPEHLEIRQMEDGEFIICAPHVAANNLYILSTARHPDQPRTFADLGRAINFANAMSGHVKFYIELRKGEGSRA